MRRKSDIMKLLEDASRAYYEGNITLNELEDYLKK